jgi:anti-anti-sigma regulatory factor
LTATIGTWVYPADPRPVIVDFTDVDVLASAGVSALFHARSQHATHGHP